ncbi:hypothetical protein LTR17_000043 [Elasticomyces elasticus]|nr:hypothetical protein LTR17_000043 [Elasticomyces elasticus]
MAPQQPTKHSRSARSAKDPRGLYAPPPPNPTLTSNRTSTSHAATTSTPHATTTSTPHDTAATPYHVPADLDTTAFEFRTNKKDKRTLRHSSLLHKVHESSGVRKKVLKPRRPGKKLGGLGSGMAGLSDALPDTSPLPRKAMELGVGSGGDMDVGEDEDWEGVNSDNGEVGARGVPAGLRTTKRRQRVAETVDGHARMKLSSVKYKPGAARRKAMMEGVERERMGRNLAGMSSANESKDKGGEQGGLGVGTAEKDRWAALRKFIGGTMEKREVAETQG